MTPRPVASMAMTATPNAAARVARSGARQDDHPTVLDRRLGQSRQRQRREVEELRPHRGETAMAGGVVKLGGESAGFCCQVPANPA
jgi:hypothetical protein